MEGLTERQEEVLTFTGNYIAEHGYSPAVRDIAAYFSISPKAAHDHISALARKGAIRVTDHSSRSIVILPRFQKNNETFLNIPYAGNIAAGYPIMSEENLDGYVQVPKDTLKKDAVYFALFVRGDSMINAGILDGDTVIIEKKDYADNGQIIVAVVNESITLKRFFREHERIRLQAENPAYDPVYYTKEIQIAGVLAMVIRKY